MAPLGIAFLVLSVNAGAAEPLKDAVERDYIRPALDSVQGAVEGREPSWTPTAPPLTSAGRQFIEVMRVRWLEPLMGGGESFAASAARNLASPRVFEAPPEQPSPADLVPVFIPKAAESLAGEIETRFLARLNPEAYAVAAARSLGAAGQEAGPAEPNFEPLAEPGDFSRPAASPERAGPAKDSTRMVRGRSGSGARPRLKASPFRRP